MRDTNAGTRCGVLGFKPGVLFGQPPDLEMKCRSVWGDEWRGYGEWQEEVVGLRNEERG